MWWDWWYPFFLFISETTCPLPSKVRRRGNTTPSGLCVRHFVFFGRSDLPPQHVWLCHRRPNNNNPPLPQKKRRLEFTQDYSLHFILPYFYAAFHSQLQRVQEYPLFMTTILLKDNPLRLLATQRLGQGSHPYYASCIVSISLVFFGDGIKLPQILLLVYIRAIIIRHGIKLPQILLAVKILGNTLGIKLPQILFAVDMHGITLARLTLILKVTSTEKYDVRRLKPF